MMLTSLLRLGLTRSTAPFRFTSRYDQALPYREIDSLGLYVHIPFCRTLCSFCPYCKEHFDPARAKAYRQALLKEIDLVGGSPPDRHIDEKKTVTSLYFGGGTPALLIDDLGTIIHHLERYFTITGGIGVELHPDDITADNLEKLRHAGVTMVSLGIQTFDRDCLAKLGRRWEPFEEKVALAAAAGFAAVDVDLIFAIPGQTPESLCRDIDRAFAQGATQVSTYPFIEFTFADNNCHPLSRRVKLAMLEAVTAHCRERGLDRTSVWTFARPATDKYSSVTRDAFLGFGVSATTLLRDQFKINSFSVDGYIRRVSEGKLPTSLTLDFTRRQRAAYFLFWSTYGLRIDASRFRTLMGQELETMYHWELRLAAALGLFRREGQDYRLTPRGTRLYHQVEQVYTTAYIDKMWNVSRTDPFPRELIMK